MNSSQNEKEVITIIYYCDSSLELKHQTCALIKTDSDRIVIPSQLKQNKSIIAVCRGEIDIINKVGDRIIGVESIM